VALEGDRIRLRELREEDYSLLVDLRNDLDTQGWSRALPPDFTVGMYRRRFDAREYSTQRDWAIFIVEERETQRAVGSISYSDTTDRFSTTIGIALDTSVWGTGIATEATEMLLRFLFVELGMRVVRMWTQSGNGRMLGSARKLGFSVAVREREAMFKDGLMRDNMMLDMLREEWFALHPEEEDHLPDPFR
jgi:ribosomal-protein-alanine N-acetyltransferase